MAKSPHINIIHSQNSAMIANRSELAGNSLHLRSESPKKISLKKLRDKCGYGLVSLFDFLLAGNICELFQFVIN